MRVKRYKARVTSIKETGDGGMEVWIHNLKTGGASNISVSVEKVEKLDLSYGDKLVVTIEKEKK